MDDSHEISNITLSGSKSFTQNKPVLCVLFVCFIFSSFSRLLHVLKCASDWIFSWKQNQTAPKRAVRSGSIGIVNDKSRDWREIGYISGDM